MSEIFDNISEINFDGLKEVYFGSVKYPPGGYHGPRIQRGLQLFHLLSGEVTFYVEKVEVNLKPGDFCLLLPGQHEFHQFSKHQESHHTWCQLDFYERPDYYNDIIKNAPLVTEQNMDLLRFMELGLSLTRNPVIPTVESLMLLGPALIRYYINYANGYTSASSETKIPRAITKACDFMSEHLAEPITLSQIAEDANITANHLVVIFNKYLSITPMKYLWRLRCQQAAVLLKGTSIPIGNIADQFGFSTQYHFSRLFKQHYGVAPSTYRKN